MKFDSNNSIIVYLFSTALLLLQYSMSMSKTGTFMKPLHRQVDENLRISRAERDKSVRVGKKVWRISLPLLNRKHEYWAPRSMTFNFSNYNR